MTFLRFLFVLCFVVGVVCSEEPSSAETNAEKLNSYNFKPSVMNGDVWMVRFYAPWCPYCKALVPEWNALVEAAGDKFHVADVDCIAEEKACSDISGYPTIRLYADEITHPLDYNGERRAADMVRFVEKNTDLGIAETAGPEERALYKTTWRMRREQRSTEKALDALEDMISRSEGDLGLEATEELQKYDQERRKKSLVKDLDPKSIADLWEKTKDQFWFINAYRPGQPESIYYSMLWEKFATMHGKEFGVGEINCAEHEDICKELNVKETPMQLFKSFHMRTWMKYAGYHNTHSLYEFFVDNKETGKPSKDKSASETMARDMLGMLNDEQFVMPL